ncbi:MAG: CAP domain-containing protein [Bacillota bacterium]
MRLRFKRTLIIMLSLFLFSTMFSLGTANPAAASTGTNSLTLDNKLISEMVSQALAKMGINTLNVKNDSYKISVCPYKDGKKVVIPIDKSKTGTQPVPQPKPIPTPQPSPAPQPSQPVQGLSADEQQMLDLVNAARTSAGLSPLQPDLNLVKLARLKAQDMIDKNYFSHNSPTYGSPFDMMKSAGITYRYAGENLAGAPAVDTAHTNLMNSPGHRANILNANFSKVGIGIVNGGPYGKMFVQMFNG